MTDGPERNSDQVGRTAEDSYSKNRYPGGEPEGGLSGIESRLAQSGFVRGAKVEVTPVRLESKDGKTNFVPTGDTKVATLGDALRHDAEVSVTGAGIQYGPVLYRVGRDPQGDAIIGLVDGSGQDPEIKYYRLKLSS